VTRFSRLLVLFSFLLVPALLPAVVFAQEDGEPAVPDLPEQLAGLSWRGIGPAFMSGRISEIAIHPSDKKTWFVAVASGGVWKTTNAGVNWKPVFDNYGSYSVGTVVIDPHNPQIVWVGTGENNSQRSVAYGDGIYKSVDGGNTFRRMGLGESEHIARILVHPEDSNTVYVAAQGPLWRGGGDRGVYVTGDGGETWSKILEISGDTGVTDLVMDPRDPDVMYAAAYQRRRHVWTLLDGGPEAGIYKTTDGGENWNELTRGLPSGDVGRIALAVSPQRPDVVYALVDAAEGRGTYASTNAGASWSKRSDYVAGSPQYYQELVVDPHQFDRIYSMDTYAQVSDDGGRNWRAVGEADKHIDNHALWIDPDDPMHHLNGNDGGLYESFDGGRTWRFFTNLPITQYYKIAVGPDAPFYTVCGGTQDNATHCGPARTPNVNGGRDADWFVPVFGDGFDPAIDPSDANIIYAQWQYGGLIRHDRLSGESIDIKPRETADGPPLRWNWDSALLISPHDPQRIYYAAQMLFRSDDRGDSWRPVSGDLTRNLDRNRLDIFGRVWGVDSVRKNNSTSLYGTIVALDESPLAEGLLYVGTDDGLIQVSEDGGASWRQIDVFPGVPDMTYVNDIEASLHDPDTVYAAFNNHKMGDFAPYVLMSTDRGNTWTPITGDLPERGSTYTLKQDHVDPDLLFVGTEFGVWYTPDGGGRWLELGAGMPTIAVRDLEIQREMNDVVAGTFGRGYFVLDDYSPLRHGDAPAADVEAMVMPVRDALAYVERRPLALAERAFQGADYFLAPNPDFGATFTYWVRTTPQTRQAQRQERDAELAEQGEDVFYPTWDELRAEDREQDPAMFLVVRDGDGNVVRRVPAAARAGVHRATWDLTWAGFGPVRASSDGSGPRAMPGIYTVEVVRWFDGAVETISEPVEFNVVALGEATIAPQDRAAVAAFNAEAGRLQRAMMGANAAAADASEQLDMIEQAVRRHPQVELALMERVEAMKLQLVDLREVLNGDPTRRRRSEAAMPGLMSRLNTVVRGAWAGSYGPQQQLEAAGVPWTPGRGVPNWQR
jgi:photosystem II stability/assembly factor-like uncharacterized protein